MIIKIIGVAMAVVLAVRWKWMRLPVLVLVLLLLALLVRGSCSHEQPLKLHDTPSPVPAVDMDQLPLDGGAGDGQDNECPDPKNCIPTTTL